jgi:exopolyphosphatase/pppGpp-phosphohydrolase
MAVKIDPACLDLYEAGMDLGLSHDLPLSYRLYEERLLEGYADWAERHRIAIEGMPTVEAAVVHVEGLLALGGVRADARRASVFRMLEESRADADHARQVARLARRLFELTASQHGRAQSEADVLEYACLLHDVGGGELGDERPYRSARKVRESDLDGFSQDERDAMAVLIAIHRTIDAQSEVEGWLEALPSDLADKVQHLGPLLRLADGLDASRRQTVRALDATIHDGLFDLRLRAKDKAKAEVKAAVVRADLFERAYGLPLSIDVEHKGPPPPIASLATPGLAEAASAGERSA